MSDNQSNNESGNHEPNHEAHHEDNAALIKSRIVEFLSTHHVGQKNAITGKKLACAIGLPNDPYNRYLRVLITELIDEEHAIGSTARGFFIINTPTELWSYISSLTTKKYGIEKRIRAVSKAWTQKARGRKSDELQTSAQSSTTPRTNKRRALAPSTVADGAQFPLF